MVELRVLGHALMDAGRDLVVDEDARQAPDLEQIAAIRQPSGQIIHLDPAHFMEVDRDAPGAGLGDDAVEGHDDDARVAGFPHRAVERRRRGRVEHDRVITLQDHVLYLGGLLGGLVLGGGEGVGGRHDALGHGRLGDRGPARQHRLTPGISGVVVGQRDPLVGGVGEGGGRKCDGGNGRRCQQHLCEFHVSLPGLSARCERTALGGLLLRPLRISAGCRFTLRKYSSARAGQIAGTRKSDA
jgi:hypothetical protein